MEENATEVKSERAKETGWEFNKSAKLGDDVNNYVIPRELTVTITLREYRSLLTQAADAKVSEYISDWCDENAKNRELQEKVDSMKKTIMELKGVEYDV